MDYKIEFKKATFYKVFLFGLTVIPLFFSDSLMAQNNQESEVYDSRLGITPTLNSLIQLGYGWDSNTGRGVSQIGVGEMEVDYDGNLIYANTYRHKMNIKSTADERTVLVEVRTPDNNVVEERISGALTKFNDNGLLQWEAPVQASSDIFEYAFQKVAVDLENNIFVSFRALNRSKDIPIKAGYLNFNNSVKMKIDFRSHSPDIVVKTNGIVKYDKNGNAKWVTPIVNTSHFMFYGDLKSIVSTNDGIISSLNLEPSREIDNNARINIGGKFISLHKQVKPISLLFKIDSSTGKLVWHKIMDPIQILKSDSAGYIYLNQGFEFVKLSPDGKREIFREVIKFDYNQTLFKISEFISDMTLSQDGHVFITGTTKRPGLNCDPFYCSLPPDAYLTYITKINSSTGEFVWSKIAFTSRGLDGLKGQGISIDKSCVTISGRLNSPYFTINNTKLGIEFPSKNISFYPGQYPVNLAYIASFSQNDGAFNSARSIGDIYQGVGQMAIIGRACRNGIHYCNAGSDDLWSVDFLKNTYGKLKSAKDNNGFWLPFFAFNTFGTDGINKFNISNSENGHNSYLSRMSTGCTLELNRK